MAQRIVIECDACAARGETREGVTVDIRALGREVEVDLCDVDSKQLAELVDRLAELGRTPREAGRRKATRATDQGERVPCPRCGKTYANRASLRGHVEKQHAERLADIADPAPPLVVDDEPVACPECGKTFAGPRKMQARGSHLSRTHGVKGESPKAREQQRARDGSHEGE